MSQAASRRSPNRPEKGNWNCSLWVGPTVYQPMKKHIPRRSAVLDVFVSPTGKDSWTGHLPDPSADKTDGPLRTLAAAQRIVRTMTRTHSIRVILRGGTHVLSRTLTFGPQDSGSEKAPVIFMAYPGETPVVSGGQRITGWREGKANGKNCWVVDLPEVAARKWNFTQLFVNGERRHRSRLPKEGFYQFTGVAGKRFNGVWYEGPDAATFAPGHIQNWRNPDDVKIVALQLWFDTHHRIKSIDTRKRIVNFRQRSLGSLGDDREGFARYYVENVFEALSPGEWYLDRKPGRLYYCPLPGESLAGSEIIAPRLDTLVKFSGTPTSNVRHIRFENMSFQHTEWDYAHDNPGSIQAAFKVPGAIVLEHAEHCTLYGCEVTSVAQYGVEVRNGCHDTKIVGCHIHHTGAGGVRIGHDWVKRRRDTATKIEHGRSDKKPMAAVVSDCVIHDCGLIFHCGIGVWIGNSGRNRIVHNHIFNIAYTGISCGWTWGYKPTATIDNRIEYNHIHHINFDRLLSDNGAIYTLGVQPGSTIRGNLIHDIRFYGYGGWGIYPDEGSGDMLIDDNIVYNTQGAAYFTHYGRDNIARNNIFAFPEQGPIEPGKLEMHRSTIFERNIVVWKNRVAEGRNWSLGHYLFRNNIRWPGSETLDFGGGMTLADWQKEGQFVGDVIADPLLLAPETGHMALRKDSPAFKIGFKPIDQSIVGPRFTMNRPMSYAALKQPAEEVRAIVKTRITFTDPTHGEVTVRNLGTTPQSGRMTLKAVGVGGVVRIHEGKQWQFKNLRPGGKRVHRFRCSVTGDISRGWVETLPKGAGLIPTLTFLERVGGSQSGGEWRIPRLAHAPDLKALSVLLANQVPQKADWFGKLVGEVRAAATQKELLLHVRVNDTNMCQEKRPYEGSCVELFSSSFKDRAPNTNASNPRVIHQILMVPPVDANGFRAYCIDSGAMVETKKVNAVTVRVEGGYELSASIPLTFMRVEPGAKKFLMDVIINTHLGVSVRTALFNSPKPTQCNATFGVVIPT